MHSNFSDLKINDKYNPNKIDNYEGKYYPPKNIVCISKNNQLPHELFHVASTMVKDGYFYSGFSQCDIKNNKYYGRGINEGYTEVMRRRYFRGYEMEIAEHYEYMNNIMDIIEEIVGKERCETLYLNADLPGLLDKISNYSNADDTIGFINDTDFVFYILGICFFY